MGIACCGNPTSAKAPAKPKPCREVAVDGALGGHHPPCEPVVRKVLLAVVHRLELVSVDGDGDGLEKVKVATSSLAG